MGVRRRKSAIVSGVADLGREETIKRALPQLFDCPRPLIPKLCLCHSGTFELRHGEQIV